MKIAVIGMGKIGLPLAVQYARKGHNVIGVDINAKTIDLINKGLEPFPEEEHLQEYLHEVIKSKNLRATASYEEAVSDADVIVVVVPLFVNEKAEPDFTAMDSATQNIGKNLKKNSLVCYETTLPIGTTRKRFTPALEQESGFKVGKDLAVAFSPERVFTGRIFRDLRKYPKIVGGITETCVQKSVAFYEQVLDFDERQDLAKPNGVWQLASTESAEFTKLAETTYRDVNIALANQFAMHADEMGVNVYEIIDAANSQKFSNIHQPGISVGGHCIPVYPQLYSLTDHDAGLVTQARKVNTEITLKIGAQILENIREKKILILGLSYRANVKEVYGSGTFVLAKYFEENAVDVYVYDPLFNREEIEALGLKMASANLKEYKNVIIHTAIKEIDTLVSLYAKDWLYIFDGRNVLTSVQDNLKLRHLEILGNKNFKNIEKQKKN